MEAIRELDEMINNPELIVNVNADNTFVKEKEERLIGCVIKFESHLTKNAFVTNVNLNALNQTVIERNITEIELTGDDKKLIQLFSFYQNNVYKQKRSRARIILQKKNIIRRRKRIVLRKNDVLVTKFYALIKNKKINLIDLSQYNWKVNEMKYAFDNNRSTIKMLLVRSK